MKLASGPILTSAEMRLAEEAAPCSLTDLMERAGEALADAVSRYGSGARTLILCGPGNNGGDGYAAARVLVERGVDVAVAAIDSPRPDLAKAARDRWAGPVSDLIGAQSAPVLIDALFGTGLHSPLEGEWLRHYHDLSAASRFCVAADLPSGIDADSGQYLGASPADLTIAFGALKPAHLIEPGAGYCGRVEIAPIGIAASSGTQTLDRPSLKVPGPLAHKYTRGYVTIVGGAMAGAAMLSARAAMQLAGYVVICNARRPGPDSLVHRRWEDVAADKRVGALLIGPGLGRDGAARVKLDAALEQPVPLVLDADALALLELERIAGRSAILTPHAGEFDALFGTIAGSPVDRARVASRRAGTVVVLKGANTVVASPEGHVRIARTAPGWLASAGTGDVLAGLAAAALAASGDPFKAACTAVWLHGEAARLAGPALIADDLAAHLPAAIANCL